MKNKSYEVRVVIWLVLCQQNYYIILYLSAMLSDSETSFFWWRSPDDQGFSPDKKDPSLSHRRAKREKPYLSAYICVQTIALSGHLSEILFNPWFATYFEVSVSITWIKGWSGNIGTRWTRYNPLITCRRVSGSPIGTTLNIHGHNDTIVEIKGSEVD